MTHFLTRSLYITAALACAAAWFAAAPAAQAQATSTNATTTATVELRMEKKFSGPDEGYVASDFSFHLTGNGVDTMLNHNGTIDLTAGTYTIEEIGPNDFDPDDWRIQWSGECDGVVSNNMQATLTIDDGNIDSGFLDCRADNQYRPADPNAGTTTPEMVTLQLEKKFSGSNEGYAVTDFTFQVTGNSMATTVPHNATIELDAGTYTITEIGPVGFDPNDWRIQWSGECGGPSGMGTVATLVINDGNIDHGALSCRADNQFRPEDNNGTTTDHAVLTVTKQVNGTTTPASNFSFIVAGSGATTTYGFDADGTNELMLDAGTYSIVETATAGFNVFYNNCTNLTLGAGDQKTCTITNTATSSNGGGNGGGSGGDEEYRIEGFVWHDDDRDETYQEDENRLSGWTVILENVDTGETSTTTTDENGRYEFVVDEGTYEIRQGDLPDDWFQTAPDSSATTSTKGSYTVTVPMEDSENGEEESGEEISMWLKPFYLFANRAHAAIVETYSGYNFGNDRPVDSSGGGGGGGNNDDDSGSSGRSGGGGGSSNNPTSSDITFVDSSGLGNTAPDGLVAGAQTSIVPAGAANAGGGATSQNGFLPRLWHWFTTLF